MLRENPLDLSDVIADGGGLLWPVFAAIALALLAGVAGAARRLVPSRSAFTGGSRTGRWIEYALVSGTSFVLLCTIALILVSAAVG